MNAPWAVVMPVPPFSRAKARLSQAVPGHHAELAHAFYLDTLRAVRAVPGVGLVVVVTADPLAACQARILGAVTVAERHRRGPGAAVGLGLRAIARDTPVAVVVPDLPALRARDLHHLLGEAARHGAGCVPDHRGERATVLTALRAADLRPALGAGSGRHHTANGAHIFDVPSASPLRLDVDTVEDLASAQRLGLGPYSTTLLALRPLAAAHAVPLAPG